MGAMPYMTGVEELVEAGLPESSLLSQNYPNPFNATTTIRYELPLDCQVKLEVYDLRGQRVATLVDGLISAGSHRVNWIASDYSSGIYFCRLSAGDRVRSKRITLLK